MHNIMQHIFYLMFCGWEGGVILWLGCGWTVQGRLKLYTHLVMSQMVTLSFVVGAGGGEMHSVSAGRFFF